MTAGVDVDTVDRFRQVIVRRLGLQYEDAKASYLADVLRRRLDVTRLGGDTYLARVDARDLTGEVAALAHELTIPETYFFRNQPQFRALAEVALPDRIRVQAPTRRLALLSAGCASGEEAYSLAMLVRDAGIDSTWDVSIRGIDLNPVVLDKARRALFSPWALRETPDDVRRRWFRPSNRDFVLDALVQSAVVFEERNLVDDDPQFWQPDTYDIVFCRNVLMYFAPEMAQAVVARIARALRPGGYLFLGHAETLRGLSNDFHLCHTNETFYYQRKEHVDATPWLAAAASDASRARDVTALVAVVERADSWVDAIARATERIESLTGPAKPAFASRDNAPPHVPASAWDVGLALELLGKERFGEALQLIRGLPSASERDADVLLLRAVLLTHSGQLAGAREVCECLLEVDELNAGAHYLLALCCEGTSDRQGALNHDEAAMYLDPGFAMPRLHLGLLARRAGDGDTARRELGQALVLLQREDASRLLLFGGGFGREALIDLARAELMSCGANA